MSGRPDVRREDGTFAPLGAETPAERTRRLTGARADRLLADPAALAAFVKSCRARVCVSPAGPPPTRPTVPGSPATTPRAPLARLPGVPPNNGSAPAGARKGEIP